MRRIACAVLAVPTLICWGLACAGRLDLFRGKVPSYTDAIPVRTASLRTPQRPIYRYSVIRGGAYSPTELMDALATDAVARAHYAVFDRASVRMTTAGSAQTVFVSYRIADRVYWTRRPVTIPANELLLTDGVLTARARCGNRISRTPLEPTRGVEPEPGDLDFPEAPLPELEAPSTKIDSLPMVVHEIFPPFSIGKLPGITVNAQGTTTEIHLTLWILVPGQGYLSAPKPSPPQDLVATTSPLTPPVLRPPPSVPTLPPPSLPAPVGIVPGPPLPLPGPLPAPIPAPRPAPIVTSTLPPPGAFVPGPGGPTTRLPLPPGSPADPGIPRVPGIPPVPGTSSSLLPSRPGAPQPQPGSAVPEPYTFLTVASTMALLGIVLRARRRLPPVREYPCA